MSQSKLLAFHVEGNTQKELKAAVTAGLAELNNQLPAGKAPAADAKPGKMAKPGKAAKSATTLEQVQTALTALKDAGEIATVKKILKKHGAKNSTGLDAEHYDAVIKAAEAAMPEEDAEEDADEDAEDEETEEEDEE